MSNLLITTRYGLFGYAEHLDRPKQLLTNREFADSTWFPVRGTFGITDLEEPASIMVASRPVRRFPWFGKHSNVKKLHRINTDGRFTIEEEFLLRGVRDVHQITSWKHLVFMADANKDRVICFDYKERNRAGEIYMNPERDGHNHLNTVLVHDEKLFIGLNKTSDGSSKVFGVDVHEVSDTKRLPVKAYDSASLVTNKGISDTHDLLPFQDTFLVTASDDGYVFRLDTKRRLFDVSGWPRGIAHTNEGIWVGSSEVARRSERHTDSDGHLFLFSKENGSYKQKTKLPVRNSGQIYDLLRLTDGP